MDAPTPSTQASSPTKPKVPQPKYRAALKQMAATARDGFSIGGNVNKYVTVIVLVLLAILFFPIGLNLLGVNLPASFSAIGNVTAAFKNADVGIPVLNGFIHAFATIIGIVLVLSPIGLAFLLARVGHVGGGKSSS